MKVENWETVKAVFAQVSEQPKTERARFLRAACGGDEQLVQEVESLLAAHDETLHVIERNDFAAASVLAPGTDSYVGKQFGHYKIRREIGRGGMGAVFLAERCDGEFSQQIALKIVRRFFDDREIVRRFRQERQILASLNHPNIARLLDGGVSADGEPYLAMEYVDGVRLDDYCDAKNLTINERLKLFLKVCAAVAFAHRNLIVHRDLKPSNILVTGDGNPKLLDFGIAKLLGDAPENENTETAFRAFTPEYASPEQTRGERITTASDVYSLGVLLEEILGSTRRSEQSRNRARGWQSKSFDDSKRKTGATNLPTNQENEPPNTNFGFQKQSNSELSNIAAMARRVEPERRYASVAQFAEDIERYLDGLPVRAQKDSFLYRAGKFAARNRGMVGAGGLAALALLVGFGAAFWQATVAVYERDRAEKRFADVRRLSNALLFDIAPKIERLPGAIEARAAVVGQSLEYLDSLARETGDDAGLQSELAAAYEKIGDLQGNPANPNFVEFEEALESYEKAVGIRRKLLEKNPQDAQARRALAEDCRVLGNIYSYTNETEKSAANSAEALQIYEALAAAQPESTDLRFGLARVNYDMSLNLQTNKKYADSLEYFERTENLLTAIDREQPRRIEVLKMLAECRAQKALALSWEEKQPQAEAEIKASIALGERLLAENPNDVAVRGGMWLNYWLASQIYQDQNDETAYEYAAKAVQIVGETVEKDPANLRARQQLAKSYSTLGQAAISLKKNDEAALCLENACRIQRSVIEKTTKNNRLKSELAVSLMRLGAVKAEQGFFAAALAVLKESEATLEAVLQSTPGDRRSSRNLAQTYEQLGETNEKLYRRERAENNRQAAKNNYQNALDILQRLKTDSALAKADEKFLTKMQTSVQKFQN